MFRSARLKLTGWYLLIIMIISVSFSVFIYRVLTSELDRVQRIQRLRVERGLPERHLIIPIPGNGNQPSGLIVIDTDILEETKRRLIIFLVMIDSGILIVSGVAGYFLAGRTLAPIASMLDEQKRFISDASHELRTPLTSMRSEIEVSLRDKKMTLVEARRLLKSNLEEVDSLQNLSDKLIKLAQYQGDGGGFVFERLRLSSIIGEAAKRLDRLARSRQIVIVRSAGKEEVEGDKGALVELLVILLDNAVKYSPKGSSVDVGVRKTDGKVVVSVKDRGMGIEEGDIPHLFDRFYRADRSRTKLDAFGYGLGLSIAKQIVDRHNGTISVQSKVGEGTTITVGIPVRQSRRMG